MKLSNNIKIQKQNYPKSHSFNDFANIEEVKQKYIGEIIKHNQKDILLFVDKVYESIMDDGDAYRLACTPLYVPEEELKRWGLSKKDKVVIRFYDNVYYSRTLFSASNYHIVNQ